MAAARIRRRALRLHAAATAIVERYDGEVPDSYDELLTLPGVGDYTAAAVASFVRVTLIGPSPPRYSSSPSSQLSNRLKLGSTSA